MYTFLVYSLYFFRANVHFPEKGVNFAKKRLSIFFFGGGGGCPHLSLIFLKGFNYFFLKLSLTVFVGVHKPNMMLPSTTSI